MGICMRCSRAALIAFALMIVLSSGLVSEQTESKHDRAFWRAIAQNRYQVPSGASASTLAHELGGLFASPDPELRDDLAYSMLTVWIGRPGVLQSADLQAFADEWSSDLEDGIGESGTNSVLKRSFSALCLASIAERDAKAPFLGDARYHKLVEQAIAYLQAERDLRGYDAKLGWIHATAHTADLLQALAGSRFLTPQEGSSILAAIASRLQSASDVYIQGEQDRLAQAVVAVVRRADFEPSLFENWLTRLQDQDKRVWAETLTPQSLARYQNHTYLLQALVVRLALEPESPKTTAWRVRVLAMLKER
jgi:hypothetical protein